MNRNRVLSRATVFAAGLVLCSWGAARTLAQSQNPATSPKVTPDQQVQLDQLKQLEQQLQKDREALRAAVTQFGWDSDQTDTVQEQLFRDKSEYRKLRRSLRQSGVEVPPPAGVAPKMGGPRGKGWAGRGNRGGPGPRHGRGMRHCPCSQW